MGLGHLVLHVQEHIHLRHLYDVVCLLELDIFSLGLFYHALDLRLLSFGSLHLLFEYVLQHGVIFNLISLLHPSSSLQLPKMYFLKVLFTGCLNALS